MSRHVMACSTWADILAALDGFLPLWRLQGGLKRPFPEASGPHPRLRESSGPSNTGASVVAKADRPDVFFQRRRWWLAKTGESDVLPEASVAGGGWGT